MSQHHARYMWQAPDLADSAGSNEPVTAPKPGIRPLVLGFIGTGNMGRMNLEAVLHRPDVRVHAVCDVDRRHMRQAADLVARHNGTHPCLEFADFRELNRCPQVDAVFISTPDHWHVLQASDAMHHGKDVYVEKPLSLTIEEGRHLCRTARDTGRVCQTGSQQRSSREFRFACELVRNGRLGRVQRIEVRIPPNNVQSLPEWPPMDVPEHFDYEMWLGPAPKRPYHEQRCHYNFRFQTDYSGGQMTNWGAHTIDIVQWALDTDTTGPVEVEGSGRMPPPGGFDTADDVDVTWRYADGVILHCRTGNPPVTEFIGTDGTIRVGRGFLESDPVDVIETPLPEDAVRLYRSDDHHADFLDCVRTRRTPICPAETGHRAASICHLGNIAIRLGRRLAWDPRAERFPNDDEANTLLARPMRAPWTLR